MPRQIKRNDAPVRGQHLLAKLPVGQATAKPMHQHKRQARACASLADMYGLTSQPEQEVLRLNVVLYHARIMRFLRA